MYRLIILPLSCTLTSPLFSGIPQVLGYISDISQCTSRPCFLRVPMGYLTTRVWIISIYDGEFFSLHCGMIKLSVIWPPAADAIVTDSVWKKGLWFHTTCLKTFRIRVLSIEAFHINYLLLSIRIIDALGKVLSYFL